MGYSDSVNILKKYIFIILSAWVLDGHSVQTTSIKVGNALHGSSGSIGYGLDLKANNSLGLGVPTFTSISTNYIFQAGFYHSASVSSNKHDADGDGLVDWQEYAGTSFKPVTSTSAALKDSDRDGASDLSELRSGTNPMDASNLFKITSIRFDGTHHEVTWMARSGKRYLVYSLPDLWLFNYANYFLAGSIVAQGGSGPWFETYATFRYQGRNKNEYFHIELSE